MNYSLSLLSKYRTQLMGFAMLWIMLIHSYGEQPTHLSSFTDFILLLKSLGYGGVDMFLLLSGIGLYYSWTKKKNISSFYKHRVLRILPIYVIITLCASLYEVIFLNYKTSYIFTSLFFIEMFQNKIDLTFAWYIPCILIFYAVTPILLKYIPSSKFNIYIPIIITVTIVCSEMIGVQGVNRLILVRFPIFLIGLYCGYLILNSKKINIIFTYIGIFLLIGVLVFLFFYFDVILSEKYGITWYIFIILAPALSIILSSIFNYLPNYSYPILTYFGNYSLTIYLLHEKIFHLLLYYFSRWAGNKLILAAIIITIIVAKPIQEGINSLVKYILTSFSLIKTRSPRISD